MPAKDDLRGIKELADRCSSSANLEQHLGDLLGCGEQGCAYSVVDNKDIVIKVTPLQNREDLKVWSSEALIGCTLGSINLAPKIYRSFDCSGYGFIVMERLSDAAKMPAALGHAVIREYDAGCDRSNKSWKADCFKKDHLSRMPVEIQKEFINVFRKAIENGFLHMDNHIENIGFLPNLQPCLFDFGFTQRRHLRASDALMALAFSIGQVLEHCPVEELQSTQFFATFCEIIGLPNSLEDLKKNYQNPRSTADTKKTLAKIKQKYVNELNGDVYVGTICYAHILGVPLERRFSGVISIFSDEIYLIRQNKFMKA